MPIAYAQIVTKSISQLKPTKQEPSLDKRTVQPKPPTTVFKKKQESKVKPEITQEEKDIHDLNIITKMLEKIADIKKNATDVREIILADDWLRNEVVPIFLEIKARLQEANKARNKVHHVHFNGLYI